MSLELKPATLVLLAAHDVLMCMGWTQERFARNQIGVGTRIANPSASCFCSHGAVIAASQEMPGEPSDLCKEAYLMLFLALELHEDLEAWNDAPGRTKKQVLAAFIKAAELSEASE